jgi:hypothetical protein
MVRYKVKFDDKGKICPNSIEQLKRNPECGIYFIEDKPLIHITNHHERTLFLKLIRI